MAKEEDKIQVDGRIVYRTKKPNESSPEIQ